MQPAQNASRSRTGSISFASSQAENALSLIDSQSVVQPLTGVTRAEYKPTALPGERPAIAATGSHLSPRPTTCSDGIIAPGGIPTPKCGTRAAQRFPSSSGLPATLRRPAPKLPTWNHLAGIHLCRKTDRSRRNHLPFCAFMGYWPSVPVCIFSHFVTENGNHLRSLFYSTFRWSF